MQRILRTFFFICLFSTAARAQSKETLVIWHTFDALPAKILAGHIKDFAAARGVEVRLETGMDVVQALMESDLAREIPDAVIGPSDIIGHAGSIGLIPVQKLPGATYADGVADLVRMNGDDWGYPLLWGNHLLLHYNTSVPPVTQLDKLKPGDPRLALQLGEPYVFLMMVLGQLDAGTRNFSGDLISVPVLTRALNDYKTLTASEALVKDCDYHCTSRDFYQGDQKLSINGDWALVEAEKKLGSKLGLAPLPAYNGIRWRSPCASFALMITRAVKDHVGKKKFLRDLAAYLTMENPQSDWFREARRIPVNKNVLADLAKKATGNHKVMLEELSRSVCILPDQRISAMWPAMRKGLRLYTSGVRSAEDTARYILQLSK